MNKPVRQLEYQKRHKEAGLCVLCPQPRVTALHCEGHRQAVNAARIARYRDSNKTGGGYHCQLCKKKGHNKRTCPKVKQTNGS